MSNCLVCGKPLTKKDHESNLRFSKKKYCSTTCMRQYMKQNKQGWWKKNFNKITNRDYYEDTYCDKLLEKIEKVIDEEM